MATQSKNNKLILILKTKNERNKRNIENKKYYCKSHNMSFRDKTILNKHLNSRKHIIKPCVSYVCELCNFNTINKTKYNAHGKTKKHIRKLKDEIQLP